MSDWLARRPDGYRRITAGQAQRVLDAFAAIMDYALDKEQFPNDVAMLARRVSMEAIAAYDKDRSCATCDYHRDGHCILWGQDIPSGSVEEGCEKHQADGAPF